jgi:starvation-inducible DNA-binding protein
MSNISKLQNSKTLPTGDRSSSVDPKTDSGRAKPVLVRHGVEVQKYGEIVSLPIGLDEKVCARVVALLNQVLVDTMALRDLYKKHHWQVSGPTFYQLHLLFDKHYAEQAELVDEIAERIQLLGGISIAMAADVAEETRIARPPRGREEVPTQISRLLNAHETLIREVRDAAEECDDAGDLGTNDLLVSGVLRRNELQVWFLAEHLIALPLVEATESAAGESGGKQSSSKTFSAH